MLTPQQFAEWAAYFRLEPWGFTAHDLWHGMLTSVVAAGAGVKNASPADFMLSTLRDRKVEGEELDVEETGDALATALGMKRPH